MDGGQVGAAAGGGVEPPEEPGPEPSRVRAGGRAAAAGERLSVRMDVLEAPSMGRERNGALTAARLKLLGRRAESGGSGPLGRGGREVLLVVSGLFCFLGCHPLVWMLGACCRACCVGCWLSGRRKWVPGSRGGVVIVPGGA